MLLHNILSNIFSATKSKDIGWYLYKFPHYLFYVYLEIPIFKTWFKDKFQKPANRSIIIFYHLNTYHIMTMCFIRVKVFYYYFSFRMSSLWNELLTVTYVFLKDWRKNIGFSIMILIYYCNLCYSFKVTRILTSAFYRLTRIYLNKLYQTGIVDKLLKNISGWYQWLHVEVCPILVDSDVLEGFRCQFDRKENSG